MEKRRRMKWALLVLSLVVVLSLSACSPAVGENSGTVSQEESSVSSPFPFNITEMGQQVAHAWQEKWPTIEGSDGLLWGEGKALLVDLDLDDVPELCLFYDNYKISTAVVYRLTADGPQELGSFDTSDFYYYELHCSIFQGETRKVMLTSAIRDGGVADPMTEATNFYISLRDGVLDVQSLYMIQNRETHEITYYDTPYNGQKISKEEADRRYASYLEGTEWADVLISPVEEEPISLLNEEWLAAYLSDQLWRWATENL